MVDGPPVKGEGADGRRFIKSGDNPLGEGMLFLLSRIDAVMILTSFIDSCLSPNGKGGKTNFLGSFFSTGFVVVAVVVLVDSGPAGPGADTGIWLGANVPP